MIDEKYLKYLLFTNIHRSPINFHLVSKIKKKNSQKYSCQITIFKKSHIFQRIILKLFDMLFIFFSYFLIFFFVLRLSNMTCILALSS